MKTLIEGKSHFYSNSADINLDQVRASHIGNYLLSPIRDSDDSAIRINHETYGQKTTEWLMFNPRTGSLFVHTEVHVLYTDYDCENQSYTVESQYDCIDSISLEEAQKYFEVSLRLI